MNLTRDKPNFSPELGIRREISAKNQNEIRGNAEINKKFRKVGEPLRKVYLADKQLTEK